MSGLYYEEFKPGMEVNHPLTATVMPMTEPSVNRQLMMPCPQKVVSKYSFFRRSDCRERI